MEVCVDSIASAINAAKGGAARLEVCSALAEGGLTPSAGLMSIIANSVSIPCFALIRPRAGDFLYSELEIQAMEHDIDTMLQCGAKGLVLGCLDYDGNIDKVNTARLVNRAKQKKPDVQLTFHRAVDMSRDLLQSVRDICDLGFHRILTSGGQLSAHRGMDTIAEFVNVVGQKITIIPGGGISDVNLNDILTRTNCKEFHASARESKPSLMKFQNQNCQMGSNGEEFNIMVTSDAKVRNLVEIFNNVNCE